VEDYRYAARYNIAWDPVDVALTAVCWPLLVAFRLRDRWRRIRYRRDI